MHQPVEIYEITSMIFGASSSPTSAQYVKNVNAEKFKVKSPEAVNAIINNHYVDDYVMSFDDEARAIDISRQLKNIHAAASFDLRNFISNSAIVIKALENEGECLRSITNFNVEAVVHKEKVLGMFWKNRTDEFVFEFKFNKIPEAVLRQIHPPTKREALSMMMSIFDPYGFLSNYHIYARIVLQSLWNMSLSWNDMMPEETAVKWFEWQSKLDEVKHFSIPRCYFKSNLSENLELHIFVDASIDAFAAVSYWRKVGDEVEVSFIYGKARVAPRKILSIPRLELQAAVLGVRMKNLILNRHSFICIFGTIPRR